MHTHSTHLYDVQQPLLSCAGSTPALLSSWLSAREIFGSRALGDHHNGSAAFHAASDLGACLTGRITRACCRAQFRKRGYAMVDWICDYYSRVGSLPVRSPVQPGDRHDLWPSCGISLTVCCMPPVGMPKLDCMAGYQHGSLRRALSDEQACAPSAPGYLAPQLPTEAPEAGEPFERVMCDVDELIVPGARCHGVHTLLRQSAWPPGMSPA